MANVGFIGLGIMGQPMAGHLLQAGHTVFAYDVVPQAVQTAAAAGATACDSPAAVGRQAETVILMLPDGPDVEQVLFGENGLAEALASGSTVVDMSSISPVAARDFAARLGERGVAMLDAPVSGGDVGAKQATLTIMVGGTQADFERVQPLLALMGQNINLVGDHGAGQTVKLVNQIIVALTVEAIGEALLFASRAGVDPEVARKAITGGAADSKPLQGAGAKMISRDFSPIFRARLMHKDLNNAQAAARALNLPLPNLAATQELFRSVLRYGEGEADQGILVQALERLANHTVA